MIGFRAFVEDPSSTSSSFECTTMRAIPHHFFYDKCCCAGLGKSFFISECLEIVEILLQHETYGNARGDVSINLETNRGVGSYA